MAEPITETLEIERLFNASIEKVFDAWTQAKLIAKWFGPEGFHVVESEIDCRPQGKYSITLNSPDNNTIKHFGEYLEVNRPEQLIFTWMLEDQSCSGSKGQNALTVVEITLSTQQQQTLLKLKHEKLPNQAALNGHRFGWTSSFNGLEKLLNRP
ncbi:SRPBCC domain-containing protein [Agaribacterium sp. ZY112]|uniref:SRPBCC family protein n=1 Tax=Agaribacterium sp. ZY112 TaxID=3233574 RepID=UPI0035234030